MTTFYTDVQVENATFKSAGTGSEYDVIGGGPITTGISVEVTRRLDRGGTWVFQMPATDPKATLLQTQRYLQFYYPPRVDNNEFGGGRIEKIEKIIDRDGQPILRVSGIDPLAEMTSVLSAEGTAITTTGGFVTLVANANGKMLASTGMPWRIVPTGATTGSLTHTLKLQTALSAMIEIGAMLGEHFRYHRSRSLEWLGPASSFVSTNVFASTSGDPQKRGSYVATIRDIAHINESREIVTRLYPTAQPFGTNPRITLADATASAPGGYARDTTNNFLEHSASTTANNLHEHYLHFSNIEAASNSVGDRNTAGNLLQDAAFQHIEQHKDAHDWYEVNLETRARIWPGETLWVQARRMRDGEEYINVDAEMAVIESVISVSKERESMYRLIVSDVGRWPPIGAYALIRKISG